MEWKPASVYLLSPPSAKFGTKHPRFVGCIRKHNRNQNSCDDQEQFALEFFLIYAVRAPDRSATLFLNLLHACSGFLTAEIRPSIGFRRGTVVWRAPERQGESFLLLRLPSAHYCDAFLAARSLAAASARLRWPSQYPGFALGAPVREEDDDEDVVAVGGAATGGGTGAVGSPSARRRWCRWYWWRG